MFNFVDVRSKIESKTMEDRDGGIVYTQGYPYTINDVHPNIDEPGLSQTKDRTGKKLIYANSDFDVNLAYQAKSSGNGFVSTPSCNAKAKPSLLPETPPLLAVPGPFKRKTS